MHAEVAHQETNPTDAGEANELHEILNPVRYTITIH